MQTIPRCITTILVPSNDIGNYLLQRFPLNPFPIPRRLSQRPLETLIGPANSTSTCLQGYIDEPNEPLKCLLARSRVTHCGFGRHSFGQLAAVSGNGQLMNEAACLRRPDENRIE